MSENKARGKRNLCLLGVAAVALAILTSGIALTIYHHTGDIYLDRSRPGFLPEKNEQKKPNEDNYSFNENTPLNKESLERFRNSFTETFRGAKEVERPFGPEPINDRSLGIEPMER